jgi:hypothetical protein
MYHSTHEGISDLLRAVLQHDSLSAIRIIDTVGVNVDGTDFRQCTALHLAAESNDVHMARILLVTMLMIRNTAQRSLLHVMPNELMFEIFQYLPFQSNQCIAMHCLQRSLFIVAIPSERLVA